jgi:phage/plasmid-like protein (TIGR03299 family)
MAHEVENMFYVGETPWHGIGVPLKDTPTIEEAIRLSGLDWKVRTVPLYMEKPWQEENKWLFESNAPDVHGFTKVAAKAVVRESDGTILADHVGYRWTPLQNNEAFQWFQPFIDNKLAQLECAGSLRGGKRVFVLARLSLEDSVIVPKANDVIRKYILLSNGHDGLLAVRVGFTPIRVVCANTLAQAHNGTSKLIRVCHSRNVKNNINELRDIMNCANQEFEATADKFRWLASKNINSVDLKKYIVTVLSLQKDEKGKRVGQVIKLFERGFGNDVNGVRGSWWAAYNAVTEHLSYERGRDKDSRLDNLWFGSGKRINTTALTTALQLAA